MKTRENSLHDVFENSLPMNTHNAPRVREITLIFRTSLYKKEKKDVDYCTT